MANPAMHCSYYQSGRCRSCSWLPLAYARQLQDKQQHCRDLLGALGPEQWLPTVPSRPQGFRNKAKMAVGGSPQQPTLGTLDSEYIGVDLRDCPLYPPALAAAFAPAAQFLARASVAPYDVRARTGEAKFLLATVADHSGELMLRFVLRSTEAVQRMQREVPWLQAQLPLLRVLTANIQPVPMAVLEGERELLLTQATTLAMQVNGLPLHLRPRSFFQTNTEVAAALYRHARDWVAELQPATLWDLYCGVGGFALHCAGPARQVTGVEASAEAIASAEASRDQLGLPGAGPGAVQFVAQDASRFVEQAGSMPDLVVVNPPRRGIGPALAARLDASSTRWVLYSSCNAESLARDLAAMPRLGAVRAVLLDMFPHTPHYEVLVLLQRRDGARQPPTSRTPAA